MAKTIILSLAGLLLLSGCIRLRDYTGVKEGVFGLEVKKGFGQGAAKKDYCVFDDGTDLVIGDKKGEVTLKLGLPDRIENTLEGNDLWIYGQRKIKLFFKGERLNGWSFL